MTRRSRARGGLGRTLASLGAGPCTVAALAERLRLDVPQVEGLLRELRSYGLAESAPGPDGVRRWQLNLPSDFDFPGAGESRG